MLVRLLICACKITDIFSWCIAQGEEEVENGEFGVEGYQGVCVTGPVLWITQAKALLVKRVVYTYRRMLSYIVQTILPLSLVILGLLIARQLQVMLYYRYRTVGHPFLNGTKFCLSQMPHFEIKLSLCVSL